MGRHRSLRLTLQDLREIGRRRSEHEMPPGSIQAALEARDKLLKYRNQPTEYNGNRYGSKLEANYARQLDNEWHAGTVLWYTRQVPFVLEGGVIYRADFLVVRPYGTGASDFNALMPPVHIEVVDSTGVMTQVKANKLKQVEARYGIVVLVQRKAGLVPYPSVPVGNRVRHSALCNLPPSP